MAKLLVITVLARLLASTENAITCEEVVEQGAQPSDEEFDNTDNEDVMLIVVW